MNCFQLLFGSLVHSLFEVKVFKPIPAVFIFREFNFIYLAIVSSSSNLTSSSSSCSDTIGKSSLSKHKSIDKAHFELLSFSYGLLQV